MRRFIRIPCLALCALASGLCIEAPANEAPAQNRARPLRVATWNLSWLVTERTAHLNRLACLAGKRPALPCDMALDQARDRSDIAKLKQYARRLNADVLALQEVESVAAIRQILPHHAICISTAPALQRVAIAVRPSLPHRCDGSWRELAKARGQRPGVQLTLFPEQPQALTLLAVHLKSGCSSAAIAPPANQSCAALHDQALQLQQWLRLMQQWGRKHLLLGDFNRAGPNAADDFWRILGSLQSRWRNAAPPHSFLNCFPGQPFTAAIDHILISDNLLSQVVYESYRKHRYQLDDAMAYRLSDHCPISVEIHP